MVSHIKELKSDSKNARKHTERNIGMLANGLNELGAGRSILIDKNNKILAGNGVVEAAAQAGITKVIEVEASGDAIIAVKRSDLTDKQARRMAILDNRAQELSEWDTEVLADFAKEGDLKGFFTEEEQDFIFEVDKDYDFKDEKSDLDAKVGENANDKSRRVVLWIEGDQYGSLMHQIKKLGEHFEMDDISNTVVRAIEHAYEEIF